MKPLKRSVSLVIENGERVLLVRRPDDDESLPGAWGLPAASLDEGETERDAVRRAGREKLGVEVRPLRLLGEARGERPAYRLVMRDWVVAIVAGEPRIGGAGRGTRYEEWRWGDPAELVPAAARGSLCARVLLDERGIH